MPVKRTTRAALTLADLTFEEKFALYSSWFRPGITSRLTQGLRFRASWADFFGVYEQVRDELRAARPAYWPCWAEVARPIFQANPDRFNVDAAHAAYARFDAARRLGASVTTQRKATP